MRKNLMKDQKRAAVLIAVAAAWGLPVTSVQAVDECGPGPTVTCAGSFSATGVTYNFSSDLSLTTGSSLLVGANGLRLNGSGDADLILTVPTNNINGTGGVRVAMGTGHVTAHFNGSGAIASSLSFAGDGGATITLGSTVNPSFPNSRLSSFTADMGGISTIDTTSKRTVTLMTLSPRAGGTMTVNNGGAIGDTTAPLQDVVAVRGNGAGSLVINNTVPRGRIRGNFDLSASTGSFTLRNDNSGRARQGGWHSWGQNTFGSGSVEIINGTRGVIRTVGSTTFDFSASSNSRFVNEGRLMMGTNLDGSTPEGPMTLIGLDLFENSGLILLGARYNYDPDPGVTSDGKAKDRLIMQDVNFAASQGSRIALDTALTGVAQADCLAVTSSDCVRFSGTSTTSGVTSLIVTDARPALGSAAFNKGMVLIEGASAAEHFVLDPESQFYVPHSSAGAGLQKGFVAYRFVHDADAKQHLLVGTLADEAAQAATVGATAQEVWRTTAESWFDRQAEMRSGGEGGFNPSGAWANLNIANGNRDLTQTHRINDSAVDYDLAQDLQTTHLSFGVDLLRGSSAAKAWNMGLTAGYVYSTIDYDATRLQATMTGFSTGLYGSWLSGPMSVDGLINFNLMTHSLDAKHLGLGSESRLRTDVTSIGARVDAGWKTALGKTIWLQPLVGLAYVSTGIGDIELLDNGGAMRFGDDDKSLRLGLGLRTGLDSKLLGLNTRYTLSARWWNEMEGENDAAAFIPNGAVDVPLTDDFSGGFSEVAAGLNIANDSGLLSGHVNVKGKFGDDYSSTTASLGVRYNW